ncbi:Predicted transcriptional regulator, ArsR family [Evansella caseinilytica]|uniref:Predicted transcriptional regulator, ArsR family n=1 Tax=Evansella caseinilytica TaxID=1503961 RepID=A0A1H3UPA0_9BACI|nr:metalloregulator ArsR/SmtB family transcription factor [Evansella caseinilytica]SDZ63569.1 Predicted transcriptional regulator, ArsR family [Evansella caseinilytica]
MGKQVNATSKAAKKTRRTIINILKQEGPMDALTMASHLNISGMAVRQHLYALQKEGIVNYEEEAREMGRPAKVWFLTAEAARFFPSGYAELTVSLLDSITGVFGAEGVDRLLAVRNEEQVNGYQQRIPDSAALVEKLEVLASIRTDEGYMAEVTPEQETEESHSYLFIEKHCPICAAATACAGFCDKELELFQRVLGENVKVQRIEHLLQGDRRCAYRIHSVDEEKKQ